MGSISLEITHFFECEIESQIAECVIECEIESQIESQIANVKVKVQLTFMQLYTQPFGRHSTLYSELAGIATSHELLIRYFIFPDLPSEGVSHESFIQRETNYIGHNYL